MLRKNAFKFLSPRNLNQDCLENYFSSVRSRGVRNVNPTCSGFIATNKSLLLNNFTSPRSFGQNCEDDHCNRSLDNLRQFLSIPPLTVELPEITVPIHSQTNVSIRPSTIVSEYASAYTAGFIVKKTLQTCHLDKCRHCMHYLCAQYSEPQNILIQARHYKQTKPKEPSSQFLGVFKKCTSLILDVLPEIVTSYQLKANLCKYLKDNLFSEMVTLFCRDHTYRMYSKLYCNYS